MIKMPTQERTVQYEDIRNLNDAYLEVLRSEEKLGFRPTELRHLLGRLGEFYCALKVEGSLSTRVNRSGYDAVCKNGRKISVKTTAQKSGFVPISQSTSGLAQDLMVVQYMDGDFLTLYYGSMEKAMGIAREYKRNGTFELDIAKLRRLNDA